MFLRNLLKRTKKTTRTLPVPLEARSIHMSVGSRVGLFELLAEFLIFLGERLKREDRPLLPFTPFTENRRRVISPGIDVSEFRRGSDFEREEPGKWRWAIVNGSPVKIKMDGR